MALVISGSDDVGALPGDLLRTAVVGSGTASLLSGGDTWTETGVHC